MPTFDSAFQSEGGFFVYKIFITLNPKNRFTDRIKRVTILSDDRTSSITCINPCVLIGTHGLFLEDEK